MRHGSLFSGIGGFDLASEWMGWENVFHCEWNNFGKKILKYYWPNAISYDDITKTDFTIHRGSIDILTGGFPCQPYSLAGQRKGTEDSRHLWPEMLRAIREIQPKWVLGENVFGIVNWSGGLVFDQVQTELEAEGYEVQPFILPACAVDAPHRRDRVWFVAYSNNTRNAPSQIGTERNRKKKIEKWEQSQPEYIGLCNLGDTSNSDSERLQWSKINGSAKESEQNSHKQSSRCIPPTWEIFPTQSPIRCGNDGLSDKLDGITFSKLRNESIKAYGNAVVPQVVFEIFKAIQEYENLH